MENRNSGRSANKAERKRGKRRKGGNNAKCGSAEKGEDENSVRQITFARSSGENGVKNENNISFAKMKRDKERYGKKKQGGITRNLLFSFVRSDNPFEN